jgi:mannose-6-phosphate isomerase-like protein (cupin superfamily)
MTINDDAVDIEAGDICLTRSGDSHSLSNTGNAPIRFLVVGTNLAGTSSS